MGTIAQRKETMRAEMRRCLRLCKSSDRSLLSANIVERLEANTFFQEAQYIALYLPLATEPDLLPIVKRWAEKAYYAPRVIDQSLSFARLPEDCSQLITGPLGNREPDAKAEMLDIEALSIVFVPGLAFDANGWRLGRGGGYYDRWLRAIPSRVIKIGVCFTFQMKEAVPHDSHDVRMDAVLTDVSYHPITCLSDGRDVC